MSAILRVRDQDGNVVAIPAIKGEPGTTPHIGENGNWFIGDTDTGVPASGGSGGGVAFETDETLYLKDGVLGVNTAHEPDPDNTLPITSAAVAQTVGNIEVILKTI